MSFKLLVSLSVAASLLVVLLVESVSAAPLNCQNCVGRKQLKSNSVITNKVGNLAITTEKLASGAVTQEKLGADVRAIGLEGVAVVSAGDFVPDSAISNCFRDDDSFAWFFGNGGGNCCLSAPVRLPTGATVTKFEVTARFGGVSSVDVDLQYKDVRNGNAAEDVSELQFSPSAAIQTKSISGLSRVVDATTSVLYVRACLLQTNDAIFGGRVFFD